MSKGSVRTTIIATFLLNGAMLLYLSEYIRMSLCPIAIDSSEVKLGLGIVNTSVTVDTLVLRDSFILSVVDDERRLLASLTTCTDFAFFGRNRFRKYRQQMMSKAELATTHEIHEEVDRVSCVC